VDGPGELLVQDAIWGDSEEPDYVPLPAEILAAEAASGDGLCGYLTAKGRPCRLLAEECQFPGVAAEDDAAEAGGPGGEPPEALEETQQTDRQRKEIRVHRLAQQRAAKEALLRKARGEGAFPWTSVSP